MMTRVKSSPPDEGSSVLPFPLPADVGVVERTEENDWLLNIQQNADQQAFRRLFERLTPRIHSYLRRAGHAPPDIDNALQDVWLVVWRKAHQFDPALASARTWIFTLIRNRLIDHERAARRDKRLTSNYADASRHEQYYEQDHLAQALGGRVARLLTQLPPEQRDVVLQCYVEGHSQRDVALAQHLPIGTIKSRARLAFERLKQLLKERA
jgi:RNA polymerase sigma factor (sigma-70 family)